MPEKPPPRYAPGELDRTRGNIGTLTQEEARKMTRILGGEIGVEKTDSRIEERYRKLKELNRRKGDLVAETRRGLPLPDVSSVASRALPVATSPARIKRQGYITAVRMAFLASRPEHGLIRRRDAWALLFFPFPRRNPRVNPSFLTEGDRLFYNHLEHFVLAVRSLLARNGRYALYRLKNGYYRTILHMYRNWNIETIHLELARLQTQPRQVSLQRMAGLYRELFKPFMILSEIDGAAETEKALKHLFDLTLLSVPKEGKEAGVIKELYISAREEIYHITNRIPRQCWPLLLYLTGSSYAEYGFFFEHQKTSILSFLGLDEKALLVAPQQAEDPAHEAETVSPEETDDPEEDLASLQEAAGNQGLSLLAELFPDSGWDYAETRPDMIPYFKPLCALPRGCDILSPDDPIHQITVLVAICADVCSGLRTMRFVTSEEESDGGIRAALEKISGSWHVIMDELIVKHYITPLTEYCRQFERDEDFYKSRYAEKLQSELYWIKRYYLTPFSYTGAFKGFRPVIQKKLPRLFDISADMVGILSRILIAAEEGTAGLLENPDDPFHFEVPGAVPLRIKAVLQRRGEKASNLNLIKTLYGIVSTLDYLVNNPESWFYGAGDDVLFRGDFLKGSAPVYAVDPLDTAAIIRSADERERTAAVQTVKTAEFGGLKEAVAFLEEGIGAAFSAVTFRIPEAVESGDTITLGTFLQHQVREWVDRVFILQEGLLLLVLPDTRTENACSLAFRLVREIHSHSSGIFKAGAGITAFEPGCSVRNFVTAGTAAADRALGTQEESIVLYSAEENRYVTLYPEKSPSEKAENTVE